jgi:hypothetical protein
VIDHISIQCAQVTRSATFYDAVLVTLRSSRVMEYGDVIGFGDSGKPWFWIGPRATGGGVSGVSYRVYGPRSSRCHGLL